jgi:hypothetical protein
MILDRLTVPAGELAQRTGWVVKPEGACKADRCVPLPDLPATIADDTPIDVRALAGALDMPVVHDEHHRVYALGPEGGGRALTSAALPPIVLPDARGDLFDLASLRGQKVVMVAWASW